MMYRGEQGFVEAVVPFIRDGLVRDEPVLVAVIETRLRVLRALGPDAERVLFADMTELGHNPARIIPAWREFTARHGGRPIRGVGEPIWAGRRDAEIVECQFHEALLNVAVPPETPLWLICPYDTEALDRDVIGEARRSHPVITDRGSCCAVEQDHRAGTVLGGRGRAETPHGDLDPALIAAAPLRFALPTPS
ncbi:MAG TPA: MEDS domain-containing protein [Mycobacterium sp.]